MFFYFLIYILPSYQLCPSPCYECPSLYYYNKGIQLKELIDFTSDCSLKSPLDITYLRDFYLSNILCNDVSSPSSCIGNLENPMDDFWKVVKKIYDDEAQKYQRQQIRIFLSGSPHFIIYDQDFFSYSNFSRVKLFKEFKNASIEILPTFCDQNKVIRDCLDNSNDTVDVYVKIDLFQFVVSFQFSIMNVRFFGNDMTIVNYKNSTCLKEKRICCYFFKNDCDIERNLIINSENLNQKSMFLLRSQDKLEIAQLCFTNVFFLNFYAIKEDAGWRSLIFSESAIKSIQFVNFTMLNFFLSHGLLYDLDLPAFIIQPIVNITMKNAIIGNCSLIFYQIQSNNSIFGISGLFTFRNSSYLLFNIVNLTIYNFNLLPMKITQYVFLFESVFYADLNINSFNFDNNKDLGLFYVNSSLHIILNDFNFKNITYSKEISFITILNKSNIILGNGIFSEILFSNSFLLYSMRNSEWNLFSIKIINFYAIFGNFSDSDVSITDAKFENSKTNYFIVIYSSVFKVINLNFSSSIFTQTAFYIYDVTDFIYNQSLCTNVQTPQFFSFLSKNFYFRGNILLYSIKILNTSSALNFVLLDNAIIDSFILKDLQIFHCSNLLFLNVKASFITFNLLNIYIFNMIFSSYYLTYFEQKDQYNFASPDVSFVNLFNFTFQKCYFIDKIISFKTTTKVIKIQINYFSVESSNTITFFELFSLSNNYKYYQVSFNNITLTKISGNLVFINSTDASVDFINVTNFYAEQLTTMQLLYFTSKYNFINLINISISSIPNNIYNLMKIQYPYENNIKNIYNDKCILNIQNFNIKYTIIPIFDLFQVGSLNIQTLIYLKNCYFGNLQTKRVLRFFSPAIKLISLEVSFIEFDNVKQVRSNFNFLYFDVACLSILSIINIYAHDSEVIYLIYITNMFEHITLKNISIININYSSFCIIAIIQAQSKSSEYTKVEIHNLIFINIDINVDYLSPMASLYLVEFIELLLENFLIKNIKNYKYDLSGLTYFGAIQLLQTIKIKNLDFQQYIWGNLDQVFRIEIIYNLEIINCRFEIFSKSPSIRKFQAFSILESAQIIFLNNEFYGMSTIEKPQFNFEEMGIVAFLAKNTECFLTIQNNFFKFNHGIRYGILGFSGLISVDLRNNSFLSNNAYYGGGIAIISVKYIYLEDLFMINCHAERAGGGMYILNTKIIKLFNSTFYNSTTEGDAGCLYARNVIEFHVKNTTIQESSAFDKAGTAYFNEIQILLIDNIIIIISSAHSGGMFFFDEKTNVIVNNSYFKSGYSSVGGCIVINGVDMNITILYSYFYQFISTQESAIILSSNILNFTIAYSIFSSSKVLNNGLGIIYLDGFSDGKEKYFNFFNNLFLNNSAFYGANIYYFSNSKLIMMNIQSILNQGSLLSFESDLSSSILIQSSFFFLTNYFSSEWSSNSLIISFKSFVIINDTKIMNNNGTKHLFESTMKASLFFNNSTIFDYFIFNLNNSKDFTFRSRIFYISNSKMNSKMSIIGYSDKNLQESFQCIYLELKESIFTSCYDSYHNFSSIYAQFLFYFFKSSVEINNATFSVLNINKNIFLAKRSNFTFNNTLMNLDLISIDRQQTYLFNFEEIENNNQNNFIKIINCFYLHTHIHIIYAKYLQNLEIINCYFTALRNEKDNVKIRAIEILNVNSLVINNSEFHYFFSDIGSCINFISELKTNVLISLKNIIFFRNEAYSSSVLYIRGNILLLIDDCFFKENKALMPNSKGRNSGKGGCMLIDCEYYVDCFALLKSTRFENNYASLMGPTILSKSPNKITYFNITFQENNDLINFTNQFSALPIQNYLLNKDFMKETMEFYQNILSENLNRTKEIVLKYRMNNNLTVASGQSFNISFILTDIFDQQITLNPIIKSTLNCIPPSSHQQISNRLMMDKGSVSSNNGFFFFENVIIAFKPSSFLNCSIDYQYPNDLIFESTNPSSNSIKRTVKINLTIFIRECIPGELYQIDEICFKCALGTYALHNPTKADPSKKCVICPENAYCDGGMYLSPLKGYWRINNQSLLIQKCLNFEACLGVGDSIEKIKQYNLFNNLSELQKIQGVCGKEYEGNLCYYCKKGLARFKQNAPCQDCDTQLIIYIKMVLSFIFIVLYVSAQAHIFGKVENEDPHFALLMKMILNHFQTMSMMDLIDFGWTYDFNFYFSVKDYLSFLSEDFFVIDCMIQEIEGNLLVNKIIFTILMPLLLSFLMFLFWISGFFYFFIKKKSTINEKLYDFLIEKMRITLLIFVFILYPEILKKGFSLLNCIIIDEVNNIEVLAFSPDIKCWSSQHIFWVLTVSLTGITSWGIIAPLFICFIIVIYNKNIYHVLHQKEYSSFMKAIQNDKNKNSKVLKSIVVNIEKDLATKLFDGQEPPIKTEIGYIKKRQVFIESKEIKILEEEELEKKINLPSINQEIKIKLPSPKKATNSILENTEEIIFKDAQTVIYDPKKLMQLINFDSEKESNISKEDLRINKVFVQEEYNIEYEYQKKMDAKKIFPSKLNLKIPIKTMIIIRNLGFIYRGYRKEYFFWEIVMFSRKFILIFIGVFTGAFPTQIKPLLLLAFLSFYIFLQLSFEPYQFEYLNELEFCSLLTAFITSLIGVILFSPSFQKVSVLFVILVLGINLAFLVFWGKMIFRYGRIMDKIKNLLLVLKKIFAKKNENKVHQNFEKNLEN